MSTITPLTRTVSDSEPPTLPSTLMSSKSTSFRSRSATERTASTAMLANLSWALDTILDPSAVLATLTRFSVESREKGITSDIRSSSFTATSHAASYPSAMRMGWMPLSISSLACSNSAPANTTTPVVPSPISASWLWLKLTSNFAM